MKASKYRKISLRNNGMTYKVKKNVTISKENS